MFVTLSNTLRHISLELESVDHDIKLSAGLAFSLVFESLGQQPLKFGKSLLVPSRSGTELADVHTGSPLSHQAHGTTHSCASWVSLGLMFKATD